MKTTQYAKIETLSNGVRIVTEKLPYVRTVALGIWVESGARHEPEELCGISHFIEHMVFKGTARRSARDIAEEMDAIGGQINAFTSNDCTCFYTRCLDTHFAEALDVLCDMFFNSEFNNKEIKSERNVVFEEIGMYEDSPEDLVIDRLNEGVFNGSPLGRPILGRRNTLNKFNQEILKKYRDSHYTSKGIVVSVAGNYSSSDIEKIKEQFSLLPTQEKLSAPEAKYNKILTLKKKPTEQNHLCFAYPVPGYSAPERFTLQLLNSVFGGGMSSRLFQRVREESGLCYSISSFIGAVEEQGLLCINTALNRETEEQAIDIILKEISRIRTEKISEKELIRVREQFKANLIMGLENSATRMNNMARNVLRYDRIYTPEEVVSQIDAVTVDDLLTCADRVFNPDKLSFSAVGKLHSKDWYENRITR